MAVLFILLGLAVLAGLVRLVAGPYPMGFRVITPKTRADEEA
ncbi:hypothetical protein [Nocardiopsis halophila]|nr:hypothetical protein [Nocardiopsis halophila]